MIFDSIENAARYIGLSPELDSALRHIPSFINEYRPKGRIDVDGQNLYANCTQYMTAAECTNLFESHDLYIDIHVAVSGEELVQYAAASDATIEKEYDEKNEASLYSAESNSAVHLSPGYFAIFFPGELHRTGLAVQSEALISKFIVKVLCNRES